MRICMIGKYPPIEGGTSVQHYSCAHALARRGHEVHVVSNAREVEPAYRVMMREEDWQRCEREYPGGGSVRIHWTAADYRAQTHIPWHNAFVTKLASLAATVIREHDLQLAASYYLEPYAVAGHMAAEMTGVPHLVRTAGSDAGRLLVHPQLGPLYHHVLGKAHGIFTSPLGQERMMEHGVPEERFAYAGDFEMPAEFVPNGPTLDIAQVQKDMSRLDHSPVLAAGALPPPPYIGMYGKHHDAKGTFDLLEAVALLARRGRQLGVLLMGRGSDAVQERLGQAIDRLELHGVVMQLPFLPPWRVPSFIRLCRAVCFLERGFDIPHTPWIPREVLACGVPLIASEEKLVLDVLLDGYAIHGYNCVAVRDVRDHRELADKLDLVLCDDPLADALGRRGLAVSREIEEPWRGRLDIDKVFANALGMAAPSEGSEGSEGAERRDDELERELEPVFGQLGQDSGDGDGASGRQVSEALLYRLDGVLPTDDDLGALYPSLMPEVTLVESEAAGAPIALARSNTRVITTRIAPAARQLLESLDGSCSVAELADAVAAGFAGDDEVRRSVHAAIGHYFRLGLIRLGRAPNVG